MFGFLKSTSASAARKTHAACSGCGLCLLVCPVWRLSREPGHTPRGRAKALQHGAGIDELAGSIESCALCGACEPVCPEEIDLVEMVVDLRRQLPGLATKQAPQTPIAERATQPRAQLRSSRVLLPGQTLRAHPETLARVLALLGNTGKVDVGEDSGEDISLALESGVEIPPRRLAQFLEPLRSLKILMVDDGLLLRYLRQWLPRTGIISLGEVLSGLVAVRRSLEATDLYVIEPRAYHADYQRLVKYYNGLHKATGCMLNLDLQRIAIPATVHSLSQRLGLTAPDNGDQARWVTHGRKITRIVVESMADRIVFERAGGSSVAPVVPVVHVADLLNI